MTGGKTGGNKAFGVMITCRKMVSRLSWCVGRMKVIQERGMDERNQKILAMLMVTGFSLHKVDYGQRESEH